MIWIAKDLQDDPVTFLLRRNDGMVINSIRWDRNAKGFGAYVGTRGVVCEQNFEKAKEAAVAAVLGQIGPDELPPRYRKRAEQRPREMMDADQDKLGF